MAYQPGRCVTIPLGSFAVHPERPSPRFLAMSVGRGRNRSKIQPPVSLYRFPLPHACHQVTATVCYLKGACPVHDPDTCCLLVRLSLLPCTSL